MDCTENFWKSLNKYSLRESSACFGHLDPGKISSDGDGGSLLDRDANRTRLEARALGDFYVSEE